MRISNLETVITGANESEIFAALKAAGYKPGKTPLAAFLSGETSEYLGFSVMPEETETPANTEAATVETPETPAYDTSFLFPSSPAPGTFAPKAADAPKTSRAKKAINAVAAKLRVKPVRKNTKIANGLELLLNGADEATLTAANLSDDIVDFVMRRVTKRGYGIAVSDGVIRLVLPEGVSAIAYGNSAD